jgi:hypothetical protein
VTFVVETVEISDGRKLYIYTFGELGQGAGDEEAPKVS